MIHICDIYKKMCVYVIATQKKDIFVFFVTDLWKALRFLHHINGPWNWAMGVSYMEPY